MKKLEIVFKVPKANKLNIKPLQIGISALLNEAAVDLKTLFVPDHLLCLISGDLMKDPVTIESGCTYERVSIE